MKIMLKTNVLALLIGLILFACESPKKAVTPPVTSSSELNWNDFHFPVVVFEVEDTIKAAEFASYVPDLEERIKEISLNVSKRLYTSSADVPVIDTIEYRVYEIPGKAGKGGTPPKILLVFGSGYFASLVDSTFTKDEIRKEIFGTMTHDITHAYHLQCDYDGDGPSIMEGLADAVRYYEGYINPSFQKVGKTWDHGFKTTGFFLVWIAETKDKNFFVKLNQSLGENADWKWDRNIENITGESVESLWEEYQNGLIEKGFPSYKTEDSIGRASKNNIIE